jgi:hypothetical protein
MSEQDRTHLSQDLSQIVDMTAVPQSPTVCESLYAAHVLEEAADSRQRFGRWNTVDFVNAR